MILWVVVNHVPQHACTFGYNVPDRPLERAKMSGTEGGNARASWCVCLCVHTGNTVKLRETPESSSYQVGVERRRWPG